jgi:hypothetical protein
MLEAFFSVMVQNWPVTTLKLWYSYKCNIIAWCQQQATSWWKSFLAQQNCVTPVIYLFFDSLWLEKHVMYHLKNVLLLRLPWKVLTFAIGVSASQPASDGSFQPHVWLFPPPQRYYAKHKIILSQSWKFPESAIFKEWILSLILRP